MRQSRRTIENTRHIADLVKQPNVDALNLKDERIRGASPTFAEASKDPAVQSRTSACE
jgi:hypothetical protein